MDANLEGPGINRKRSTMEIVPPCHAEPYRRTFADSRANFDSVPHELREFFSWVGWKYGALRSNGKREKVPINPHTGGRAKPNGPTTWGSFGDAVAAMERYELEGVGFMFSENDPFVGVDIDNCIDSDGVIAPWALKIVRALASYAEISPSRTGIKIIVRAELPGGGRNTKHVEMYGDKHFFTITGDTFGTDEPIRDAQVAVEALYRRIERKGKTAAQEPRLRAPGGFSGNDAEMIDKARSNPKFRKLYDAGDAGGYASASEADLALCGYAAFWTGRDRDAIDRWFRQSALYPNREKKWERDDYREPTIDKSISGCTNVYDPKARPRTNGEAQQRLVRWVTLLDSLDWSGRGGPIDRKVFEYVINTGLGYGRIWDDEDVLVSVSVVDAADHAGCSTASASRALLDLQEKYGFIEMVTKGRKGRATQYRIKPPPEGAREPEHIVPPNPVFNMFTFARLVGEIRNAAPFERKVKRMVGNRVVSSTIQTNRNIIRPITKADAVRFERVVQHGRLTRTQLHALGGGKGRVRDVPREMARLVEAGLVLEEWSPEDRDIVYVAPTDVVERLEEHIEASGCREAAERQRQRHEEKRERQQKYLYPHQPEPEEPVEEPDGYIEDLERVEEEVEPEVPVEDHHEHGLGCECIECSIPVPKYAIPYARAA